MHAAAPCPVPVKRQMIEWWGPIIHEYYPAPRTSAAPSSPPTEWLEHPGSVGRPTEECHIVADDGAELPPARSASSTSPADGRSSTTTTPTRRLDRQRPRLAHPRRHGLPRRGRLPLPHRSPGPHDHLRRREHLPAGDRERAARAPGGRRRRRDRRPRRRDGRGGEGRRRARRPDHGRSRNWKPSCSRSAARELASYKCPKSIDFTDELPRSDNGKLYKRVLREPYWAGHETSI